MNKILVLSRIKTPDGTILTSKHVHDYQTYVDKNGETYMLDGGNEYQRTSINKEPAQDVSLYLDSDFEEIRKYVCRGTFDENGNRIWKPLCEMESDHLRNCITYNLDLGHPIDCLSNILYMEELKYRKLHETEKS